MVLQPQLLLQIRGFLCGRAEMFRAREVLGACTAGGSVPSSDPPAPARSPGYPRSSPQLCPAPWGRTVGAAAGLEHRSCSSHQLLPRRRRPRSCWCRSHLRAAPRVARLYGGTAMWGTGCLSPQMGCMPSMKGFNAVACYSQRITPGP